jgi:hypothetical protein
MEANREEGAKAFGFDPAKKTVLISGGSRGARAINRAMVGVLVQAIWSAPVGLFFESVALFGFLVLPEQGEEAALGKKLDEIRRWKEEHRAAK